MTVEAKAIVQNLKPTERKALLTRDGQGEFSTSTFERLLAKGLVDQRFHWTDLGLAVRAALVRQ